MATFYAFRNKKDKRLLVSCHVGTDVIYQALTEDFEAIQILQHLVSFKNEEEADRWQEQFGHKVRDFNWIKIGRSDLELIAFSVDFSFVSDVPNLSIEDQIALDQRRAMCGDLRGLARFDNMKHG